MTNNPNMSYCMCENTVGAMRQIINALKEDGLDAIGSSVIEQQSFNLLYDMCLNFMDIYETLHMEEKSDEYTVLFQEYNSSTSSLSPILKDYFHGKSETDVIDQFREKYWKENDDRWKYHITSIFIDEDYTTK